MDEQAAELLFRYKFMRLPQDVGLLTKERTELRQVVRERMILLDVSQ